MLPEPPAPRCGVMSLPVAAPREPERLMQRDEFNLDHAPLRFRWPVGTLFLGTCAIGVMALLPFLWRSNIPYGTSPVILRIAAGCALLFLGSGAVAAAIADRPGAARWVAAWTGFGIIATAYARGGTLFLSALALAAALGALSFAVVRSNRAWRGFWFPSRRKALTLGFIWAAFGIMVVLGASLPGALRQSAVLAMATPLLTPWGARVLGALLRALASTTRGALDSGLIIYLLTVALLVAGGAFRQGGTIPHVPIAGGFTLSLHDIARWAISIAFALYVARRPVLDKWMRNRLFVALGILTILFLWIGERYSLLLMGAAVSVVATTVWGIRRTTGPVAFLLMIGMLVALSLSRLGEDLPQERLRIAIGASENAELNRARLALRTAGWTGISGAHLERLSMQSVTDYAVSAIALNYGRLGLFFAIMLTFTQVMLLYVASAQLRDVPARLLSLALVSNIGLQALLPILALTPWPIPYGGVPWCIAARSTTQLLLQVSATSAIIGAVSGQDRGEQ